MADAQTPTILYVEDDPDFREAVEAMLVAGGYDVEAVPTAEEGLAAFQARRPDAVLLDLMLEEVDSGVTLATRIRGLDRNVPILLLTSVGDAMVEAQDWGRLGVTGVLQKPVNADTLRMVIQNARRTP
ncbi:MAG: response regulator [Gemmatimonadetes bacterium]|nr:response regulator [Gemmatimonadota bacterium]MBT8404953.1 response regulator [Gemmatimonadota bacterium]NNK64406.1 response regulator [Gemmatimonadota bacterium]